MTMRDKLLEQWKQHDPLLADLEGFQRFLEANELKRLVRLCHPNQHGEPFHRGQVIRMIEDYSMQILDDLGWPSDWQSKYRNIHTGTVETIESILKHWGEGLSPCMRQMHDLEEGLNELTNGEFYGGAVGRGLETFKVTELRRLAKKHDSPEFKEILYKAVFLHKGFYERVSRGDNPPVPLTDEYFKGDISVQNISSHCRRLGIDLEEIVPDSDLPPKSYDSELFTLLEHWEPLKE